MIVVCRRLVGDAKQIVRPWSRPGGGRRMTLSISPTKSYSFSDSKARGKRHRAVRSPRSALLAKGKSKLSPGFVALFLQELQSFLLVVLRACLSSVAAALTGCFKFKSAALCSSERGVLHRTLAELQRRLPPARNCCQNFRPGGSPRFADARDSVPLLAKRSRS